ncbi:30S ribosomal protein S16 [Streptacidiphilus sp. MAP5-3]|uniref:30S ribosomal protein S16 n=1 Tax=unclassified Streptacidiphilus TaxID=2643834 RepID=UPI0035175584
MAVKIKLKRLGKIRSPHYRIVVADARTKRDGRAIEEIGIYQPTYDPSIIEVDSDRAQYWLGVGAQPTEAVLAILKLTGDWQKFKGLEAPAPLKVAEPKITDFSHLFAKAVAGFESETTGVAITPKSKKTEKKDEDAAAAESDASAEA